MSGNLCRCAAYPNIVDAIREVPGCARRRRPDGMKTFDYEKRRQRPRLRSRTSTPGAKFIAGGTNLLDLMKLQVETPDKLVDISRLDLAKIEEREDGGLTIGALVPNSDLAADRRVIAELSRC